MRWDHKVKIKHLFTEKEDHKSVKESMKAIADVLKENPCFNEFDLSLFRKIPRGNSFFRSVDCANKLLERLYDFADLKRIWIG